MPSIILRSLYFHTKFNLEMKNKLQTLNFLFIHLNAATYLRAQICNQVFFIFWKTNQNVTDRRIQMNQSSIIIVYSEILHLIQGISFISKHSVIVCMRHSSYCPGLENKRAFRNCWIQVGYTTCTESEVLLPWKCFWKTGRKWCSP